MKKTLALMLAVLMALSLCACGQSRTESSGYYAPSQHNDNAYSTTVTTEEAYAEMEAPSAAMDADDEAYTSAGGLSDNASGRTKNGGADSSAADIDQSKIIYSAEASVETTEFDVTLEKLQALIAENNGFIESSSVSGKNYYYSSRGTFYGRSAQYTIRIPSARFSALTGSLSTLGNVPYCNTYTDNITTQYYDTQSRLEAYRTQEQSLLAMMEKAETVSDLLEIEDKLSEVRYNIESLQSRLTNWDRLVSYSTVTLSINEVEVYTPEKEMSFAKQLGIALRRGLSDIGNLLRDLLLWLTAALPTLVVLAVVVVIVLLVIRRAKKRRAARRSAAAVQRADTPEDAQG